MLTLHMSANEAPRHHCTTASMSSTLKEETYSSSTTGSLDSFDTLAIRRAISCITRKGAASSSLSLVGCVLCAPRYRQHRAYIDARLETSTRTFSANTKQLSSPALCSGDSVLKTPLKISSVSNNSSPVLISHATRPFMSTMSSAFVNPNRRSTRFRDLSSSSCKTSLVALIRFLSARMRSCASRFCEYCE